MTVGCVLVGSRLGAASSSLSLVVVVDANDRLPSFGAQCIHDEREPPPRSVCSATRRHRANHRSSHTPPPRARCGRTSEASIVLAWPSHRGDRTPAGLQLSLATALAPQVCTVLLAFANVHEQSSPMTGLGLTGRHT